VTFIGPLLRRRLFPIRARKLYTGKTLTPEEAERSLVRHGGLGISPGGSRSPRDLTSPKRLNLINRATGLRRTQYSCIGRNGVARSSRSYPTHNIERTGGVDAIDANALIGERSPGLTHLRGARRLQEVNGAVADDCAIALRIEK